MSLLTLAQGETSVARIVTIVRQAVQYLNGGLPVTGGGTGLATLTANAVLLGEGTSPIAFATIGTAGRTLIDQGAGADPAFKAMSGDATITGAGVVTVGSTGTWTPTDASGAGLTFTAADGNYVKVGKMVMAQYRVVYPVTADVTPAVIGGLPFTEGTAVARAGGACSFSTLAGVALIVGGSTTHALPFVGAAQKTNAQMSTIEIRGSFIYEST